MFFIHPHIELLQITYACASVRDLVHRHRLPPRRSTSEQCHQNQKQEGLKRDIQFLTP
jgi:hypothetical protein